jgi:hypothetical protein
MKRHLTEKEIADLVDCISYQIPALPNSMQHSQFDSTDSANMARRENFASCVEATLQDLIFDDESSRLQFPIPLREDCNPYPFQEYSETKENHSEIRRKHDAEIELVRLCRTDTTRALPRWQIKIRNWLLQQILKSEKPISPENLGRLAREGEYGSPIFARRNWEGDKTVLTNIYDAIRGAGHDFYLLGITRVYYPNEIMQSPLLLIPGTAESFPAHELTARINAFRHRYTRTKKISAYKQEKS